MNKYFLVLLFLIVYYIIKIKEGENMGLIKAMTSSISKELGDQFKEFIVCPSVDEHVLIQKGIVKHGEGNKNPSEGIITKGSQIVVPAGMAMMIVDNGEITEFSAEAGTFTYDKSTEPTVFDGGFFKGIGESIKTIGRRITYGGQPAHDQRVYYVNMKVITGNKFGSPQPKKITDEKYGILEVTFFGEYAFKVEDPVRLVANVIGANPKDTITYEDVIGSQLKTKFIEKVTYAISNVMRNKNVSFGDMGLYGSDISSEMNTCLNDSWKELYGLVITDVAIGDINLTDESMKRVSRIDDAKIFSDTSMQSGLMASASAEAMTKAAENGNGTMAGFMGMSMANQMGATMMGAVQQNQNHTENQNTSVSASSGESGTSPKFCSNCGAKLTGKFCSNCGAKAE